MKILEILDKSDKLREVEFIGEVARIFRGDGSSILAIADKTAWIECVVDSRDMPGFLYDTKFKNIGMGHVVKVRGKMNGWVVRVKRIRKEYDYTVPVIFRGLSRPQMAAANEANELAREFVEDYYGVFDFDINNELEVSTRADVRRFASKVVTPEGGINTTASSKFVDMMSRRRGQAPEYAELFYTLEHRILQQKLLICTK